MPHDARVAHQPLHVRVGEARQLLDIEVGKSRAECLALVQDGEPRQAGLEAFQADLLEQAAVVGDRESPFAVVVGAIGWRGLAPDRDCRNARARFAIRPPSGSSGYTRREPAGHGGGIRSTARTSAGASNCLPALRATESTVL